MTDDESLRLEQRFSKAVSVLQSLGPEELGMVPTNDEKLQFYGMYKQATVGLCLTPRPSMWDVVGRSKWDAWNRVKGLTQAEAKEEFPDRPLAAEVIEYFELSRTGLASDTDSDDEFSDHEEIENVDIDIDETVHVEVDHDVSMELQSHHSAPSFNPPIDTPPHYEERIALGSPESSSSSRILDGLIERIRDLEVEVSNIQADTVHQQQLVKNTNVSDGSILVKVSRLVLTLLPSACWNLACAFVALLFFGYRPNPQSKLGSWLIWLLVRRQQLNM
ncbi:acyl CoA binding protein-domain-containing protein [Powellomyces hirtus]|nr:acyl CoA binding protein-domain-containing protein [Powellomyces hirtus]